MLIVDCTRTVARLAPLQSINGARTDYCVPRAASVQISLLSASLLLADSVSLASSLLILVV